MRDAKAKLDAARMVQGVVSRIEVLRAAREEGDLNLSAFVKRFVVRSRTLKNVRMRTCAYCMAPYVLPWCPHG